MAITKQITKVDVKESSGNKAITILVEVMDNGVVYDSTTFTLDYKKTDDVEEKIKGLQGKIQEFLDVAVENRTYFNHVKFDNAVTWLNANTSP